MSWRTVIVSNRAKLELQLNHMVVRGEETTKIHLGELYMLIIENTAVSITASLLCELTKRRIKVIFCDEKRFPISELMPYYGSHDTSSKIREQLSWSKNIKDAVWTEIVTEKIRNQQKLLIENNCVEANLLGRYITEIEFADTTNREGHAAKVYFNALFGLEFTRTADLCINAALNYGYSILLSAFCREIVANGYITQLGLFHDNMFNSFNLASDFMEPFRPVIDRKVLKMMPKAFEKEQKMQIVALLGEQYFIDGQKNYLNNAVKIYCKSVFNAINCGDVAEIKFIRFSHEL